jgi:hypothetical protein
VREQACLAAPAAAQQRHAAAAAAEGVAATVVLGGSYVLSQDVLSHTSDAFEAPASTRSLFVLCMLLCQDVTSLLAVCTSTTASCRRQPHRRCHAHLLWRLWPQHVCKVCVEVVPTGSSSASHRISCWSRPWQGKPLAQRRVRRLLLLQRFELNQGKAELQLNHPAAAAAAAVAC